jgi:hypothetical protein
MKKNHLFACLLIIPLALTQLNAQTSPNSQAPSDSPSGGEDSKWFVRVYGSFGLATPASYQLPPSISYNSTASQRQSSFKTSKNGLGQGVRAGLGLGYIVSDFINLGIDADMYWSVGDIVANYGYQYTSEYGAPLDSVKYRYSSNEGVTATMINLMPNITFKAISKPNFYIYNRLGVCVGLSTQVKYTNVTDDYQQFDYNSLGPSNPRTIISEKFEEKESEYQGGVSLGYFASLGVQAKLTQQLRVFAEVQAINIYYTPKKLVLTKYTLNGADRFSQPTTTTSEKETVFLAEYTTNNSQSNDDESVTSQPTKASKIKMPFSSVGLSIGLAFRF